MKFLMWIPVLFLIAAVPVTDVSAQSASFEVDLGGHNKVPPIRTPGLGKVEVVVEGDSLFVSGTFEEMRSTFWSAFIHYGGPRETGNPMFRLKAELNEERTGGVFRREDNAFEMRPAQKRALQEGKLYINISSSRHQDGELRGQIPRL